MRLPDLLACLGGAMIGFWPGTMLSGAHLLAVTACLVPLGVRTLLRLEDSLTPPATVTGPRGDAGESPDPAGDAR